MAKFVLFIAIGVTLGGCRSSLNSQESIGYDLNKLRCEGYGFNNRRAESRTPKTAAERLGDRLVDDLTSHALVFLANDVIPSLWFSLTKPQPKQHPDARPATFEHPLLQAIAQEWRSSDLSEYTEWRIRRSHTPSERLDLSVATSNQELYLSMWPNGILWCRICSERLNDDWRFVLSFRGTCDESSTTQLVDSVRQTFALPPLANPQLHEWNHTNPQIEQLVEAQAK